VQVACKGMRPSRASNGSGISLYYVHTDHLNTPRRISRPSDNTVVWRWNADPFGAAAADQDPDGDAVAFVYGPRLPGQYYDAESGLNYNYFRDYDPHTGRYLQSDPIGLGGINTYSYVGSNPISRVDPFGLLPPRGTITRNCGSTEWKHCEQYCAPRRALGCYVTLKFKLAGVRGGNRIGGYQLQSINCKCDDGKENFCSANAPACLFTGIITGLALCAAPEITIPAVVITSTATAPAH
jgi:RHS repeat-associated protein